MNATSNIHHETEQDIKDVCNALQDLLISKNRAYGDSALNPRRIFSRSDALEQINVRIDDKLSRIANGDGSDDFNEDPEWDLLGYLVLLRIARRRKNRSAKDIVTLIVPKALP